MNWINIETDKPQQGKWVLLYNGHFMGVGKYRVNDVYEFPEPEWSDEIGEYITPEPTHWMPLPEPPIK